MAESWILHAKLFTINRANLQYIEQHTPKRTHWEERPCFELVALPLWLHTSTSEILNSSAWLLLFEVLCEILSLCFVSCEICCTTMTVDSVIANYICWKSLFIPEISSRNKSSVIKKTFYWLSTTRTPKIVTIFHYSSLTSN